MCIVKLNLTRVVSKGNIAYVRYLVTQILIQTQVVSSGSKIDSDIPLGFQSLKFESWTLKSDLKNKHSNPNFYDKKFDIQSSNFDFSAIR